MLTCGWLRPYGLNRKFHLSMSIWGAPILLYWDTGKINGSRIGHGRLDSLKYLNYTFGISFNDITRSFLLTTTPQTFSVHIWSMMFEVSWWKPSIVRNCTLSANSSRDSVSPCLTNWSCHLALDATSFLLKHPFNNFLKVSYPSRVLTLRAYSNAASDKQSSNRQAFLLSSQFLPLAVRSIWYMKDFQERSLFPVNTGIFGGCRLRFLSRCV